MLEVDQTCLMLNLNLHTNARVVGLGVLFGKLQQGVKENQQMLTIARMRADAEDSYGQHIGDIGTATDRVTDGFSKDDGASVRKVHQHPLAGRMGHQATNLDSRHMMAFVSKCRRLPRNTAK